MFTCIGSVRPCGFGGDSVSWRWSSDGIFLQRVLAKLGEGHDPILPCHIAKFIWKNNASPWAQLMVWLGCLGRLKAGYFLLTCGLWCGNCD